MGLVPQQDQRHNPYDEAKKAKMKTVALLYNMPEIFPNLWWQSQRQVSLFSGTPFYQWKLNKRYGHLQKGLKQPDLDDYVLNSMRHYHGSFSQDEMLQSSGLLIGLDTS